jgi:hypothetical protein
MGMQSAVNKLIGTAGAATILASKLSEGSKEPEEPKAAKVKKGIDAKMAAKARRIAQQKINTIYANKELSNKAKTRRIGKVMDEYNKTLGGDK